MQDLKRKVCLNFQMSFLHLSQMDPLEMRLQVSLTFLSDLWVRLTFGQMYPLVEASSDQSGTTSGQADLWSDIPHINEALRQVDIFVRSYSHTDLWSDVPPWLRHLVAKSGTTSGQAGLWSDVTLGRDILWPRVVLLQFSVMYGNVV